MKWGRRSKDGESDHPLFSAQDSQKNNYEINLEILFFLFFALRCLCFVFE